MSVFGFSTEPSNGGGDFTPIVKYDARAGRIFRVDRLDTGNGFENNPVDITSNFKAVFDFENVEVGWIDFPVGSAPSFALVRMGQQLPERPSAKHKNGIRMLLKLAKGCGGDKPVREIAGTSKAFLSGIEAVYTMYLAGKDAAAGRLPVVVLVSTTPVSSGSGDRKSTNYHPVFQIVDWVERPDDLGKLPADPAPKGNSTAPSGTAPSTGATVMPPPKKNTDDNDFG